MGYPGDQSQSGGWPPEQPSQSPYGPGQGTSTSPYGQSPFSPPPTGPPAGPPPPPGEEHPAGFGSGAVPYDPYGPGSGSSDGNPYSFPTDHSANPYAPGGSGQPGDPYGDPGPYAGSHDSGYDAHDPNRGGPVPPERSKKPLIIGGIVGAVVLIGGGIMAVSFLGGSGSSNKAGAQTAPAAANPQGTAGSNAPTTPAATPTTATGPLGAKLKSRSSDPQPLTLDEVFKNHAFGKYVLSTQREDSDCTKIVHGSKFAAALKSGGCTQLLRATYSTTDGKLIGTVGVANMKTETAAKKVQQAGGGKDAWLLPLPGSGTTKKIGKGSALGTAETRGHYVLLSWVQRPDGKQLTSGQQGTVSTFVAQVILGSNLSTALQYRGISGKPYGT
jgi:hypothetical protein